MRKVNDLSAVDKEGEKKEEIDRKSKKKSCSFIYFGLKGKQGDKMPSGSKYSHSPCCCRYCFFLMIFCVLNKNHVSSVQSSMFVIYELLCVVCVWVQNCQGKSPPCSFFGQHYRPTCEITRFNPCVISMFVFVCCKSCLGAKVQRLCTSSPKFSVCLFVFIANLCSASKT